jgi:lipid-A-disaccharide synthase-like uncharacterized protein
MHDSWRLSLYPIGYFASLLFGLRFGLQWLQSERKGSSVTSILFWKLSLLANILMASHYLIQSHFAFFTVQVLNAFLAYRNAQLLKKQASLNRSQRILCLGVILLGCILIFLAQSYYIFGFIDWVHSPYARRYPLPLSWNWHTLGLIGITIFSLRFWLQWWVAEEQNESYLHPWFWQISLIGAFIVSIYSWRLQDPVTFIGSALPMLGYMRNLYLLKKN